MPESIEAEDGLLSVACFPTDGDADQAVRMEGAGASVRSDSD